MKKYLKYTLGPAKVHRLNKPTCTFGAFLYKRLGGLIDSYIAGFYDKLAPDIVFNPFTLCVSSFYIFLHYLYVISTSRSTGHRSMCSTSNNTSNGEKQRNLWSNTVGWVHAFSSIILSQRQRMFPQILGGSVLGFSSNYYLPVVAKNVSTKIVGSVLGFFSIYPLPVSAKNVLHKYGVIGPRIFLYLPSPGGSEECFHEYGGLGPWIFLYLSSPVGSEECCHKNVMIGPWLFLYLPSPGGGEECFHKYGGTRPWIFL